MKKNRSRISNRLQEARQADEFSAELSELNRRAAEVRDSRGALEVQRAEAQARQTFVHENCQTELGQSLEDLARELTFPEEFDLEASHTRVEELRTRLEGFGGVNMMALEELAEAEERLLFLTVQRQDIIEGISATEEALREISVARASASGMLSSRLTRTSARCSRSCLVADAAR